MFFESRKFMGLMSGALVFLMVGCHSGATKQGEGPKASEDQAALEAGSAGEARQEGPSLSEVAGLFEGMLEDVKITEGAPPVEGLGWETPEGCKLSYSFDAELVLSSRVKGKDLEQSQGMVVGGTFELSRGGQADLVVDYGKIELAHKFNGVKRPGSAQPAGTMAQTWLKKQGGALLEVDGPTGGWSAYGSYPGSAIFFPALPQGQREARWPLRFHARGSGTAVEARRGTLKIPEGAKVSDPVVLEQDATVRLLRWVKVDGQPAALFKAQWRAEHHQTHEQKFPGKDKSVTQEINTETDASGHYLVLASGRLLAASVKSDMQVNLKTGFEGGEPSEMDQTHALRAGALLQKGCGDGDLVLKRSASKATPQEVALSRVASFQKALLEGRYGAVAGFFEAGVVEAHGPRLVETLKAHVSRYEVRSLGAPQIAQKVEVEGDVVRLHLIGGARGYETDQPTDNMTIHSVYKVRVRGDEAIILQMGADTVERDEGWEFFEISVERLKTAADVAGAK